MESKGCNVFSLSLSLSLTLNHLTHSDLTRKMVGEDPSTNIDPISRPESRVSQSEVDEDESFVDVEESTNTTTTMTTNESNGPTTKEGEEEEETVPTTNSIAPHLDEPPTSTSNPSQSSLSLSQSQQDPSSSLTPDELVAFLRGQITDLTSQVTSLNGKLVKSYTTRGDLEDNLHETKQVEMGLRKRVKELEVDKERWTKEIEQGGWVERVRSLSHLFHPPLSSELGLMRKKSHVIGSRSRRNAEVDD